MALRMAQAAGGSPAAAAASIAGGKILALLEGMAQEDLAKVIPALAALQSSESSAIRARTDRERLALQSRTVSLDEQKFEIRTCELFAKWYGDERARRIMESNASNAEKIEALRAAYFADVDALDKSGEVVVPK